MNGSDYRKVFGENLAQLCATYPSVSRAARELDINRTQLIRYLNGESFPRPDQLIPICDHFGVDARILTTPINEIQKVKSDSVSNGLAAFLDKSFQPVPEALFPDGFYNEWSFSQMNEGYVDRFLGFAFTQNGQRFFKIRAPNALLHLRSNVNKRELWDTFIGQAFLQLNNFAIIDRGVDGTVIAMTSYVSGYRIYPRIYPGYKLSGSSWDLRRPHARMPCVLEYLGDTQQIARTASRAPLTRLPSEVPDLILDALNYARYSREVTNQQLQDLAS